MADPLYRVFLASVLILFLAADSPLAQQPTTPSGPLTLEQVLDRAQARSEAIEIARTGVQRAEGDYVTAVYDDRKAVTVLEAAVGRPLR